VAHHQQAAGPGGEHGLQRRETDEVQILGRLVQHQQVRGRTAVATRSRTTWRARGASARQQKVVTVLAGGKANEDLVFPRPVTKYP